MSIRNEFEKIDPTEKQKKDIFRRIEESSKLKTDFRHQVIRYTSVAAAMVVVVGAVTVGVHFVTKGNGIDYTVSGSSSGAVSAVDASASKADDRKDNVQDGENISNVKDSLTDNSGSENSAGSSADDDYAVINDDVMWGIGKTVYEIEEKYGAVTAENDNVYTFENGYGKYTFGDSCKAICEISARNFLVGDISTVTLENFASKCGFEAVTLSNGNDSDTKYDGLKTTYYKHPSYDNVTFIMLCKESGFDETATFDIRCDDAADTKTQPEITTDDNGNCLINKAFHDKIMNDELTDDEFTKLISYVYTGDVSINEQPNSLVKARTEYNKTIQRTFNRFLLSGGYENDDEWHITPATPGNCHSMKEWYDTACTLYADMPDYDTFLSRYSEYFKFDEQGNFYYATGRPDEQLIGGKMPFNAPSYNLFDVSPRCFTVNESTSGGTGLSIGVLYFYSVSTDDKTYGVNVAYFDVKKTSEGYRFITNEN